MARLRGGPGGCAGSALAKPGEPSPTRVGVCCTRSLDVTGSDPSGKLRASAAERILKYETALNQGDQVALEGLYASRVGFGKKQISGAELAKLNVAEQRSVKDLVFAFDACAFEQKIEGDETLAFVTCNVLYHKSARFIPQSKTLFVFTPALRIAYYGPPGAYTPVPVQEKKQRVNEFQASPE